jgi:hypothetical protein
MCYIDVAQQEPSSLGRLNAQYIPGGILARNSRKESTLKRYANKINILL